MNLKECLMDNEKCENINIYIKDTNTVIEYKKNGKILHNINTILNKRVYNSIRVGNEAIDIEIMKWS